MDKGNKEPRSYLLSIGSITSFWGFRKKRPSEVPNNNRPLLALKKTLIDLLSKILSLGQVIHSIPTSTLSGWNL